MSLPIDKNLAADIRPEASGFIDWDNKLWIASDGGGIYSTGDAGNTFKIHNKGIEVPMVTAIELHKNKLYCATKFYGLYEYKKETDRWYRLKNGLTDSIFWSLKSNGEYLFATSEDEGLLRSKNGLDWERVNVLVDSYLIQGDFRVKGKVMLHTKGKILFLATPSKLTVSTDNGNTWRYLVTPFSRDLVTLQHIGGCGDTLVISYNYGGTYVSTKGGFGWTAYENKPSRAWTANVLNGHIWACNPFHHVETDFGVYLLVGNAWVNVLPMQSIGLITYHKGYYFLGSSANRLYRFKYPAD